MVGAVSSEVSIYAEVDGRKQERVAKSPSKSRRTIILGS